MADDNNSTAIKSLNMSDWELVIGLEIHVQLTTKSKMFSSSPNEYGAPPNTNISVVDLAMPGTLPVVNLEAVKMAIQLALCINAIINRKTHFERKNYIYPDIPKDYQLTQMQAPIIKDGYLEIDVNDNDDFYTKTIRIPHAHLEEDAGKLLHINQNTAYDSNLSFIDYNRAGVPLIEIVSAPDMRSAKEAISYLKTIHAIVCYLGICDGNMQEGSFRCDANVSVMRKGSKVFGTRTELKNLNSFKFVEKAINYEFNRQVQELMAGGTIRQETRLYDSARNITIPMRDKENAGDYRYFADPDLLPIEISDDDIDPIKKNLPELPKDRKDRFINQYNLSKYDASVLTSDKNLADFYEAVMSLDKNLNPKLVSNWISVELMALLNNHSVNIKNSPIKPNMIAELVTMIMNDEITGKIAKQIFAEIWVSGKNPRQIAEEQNLTQVSDDAYAIDIVKQVLNSNPKQVNDYINGKTNLLGYFVGQAMKLCGGKLNPQKLQSLFIKELTQ